MSSQYQSLISFFSYQVSQIKEKGSRTLLRKLYLAIPYLIKSPFYVLALPGVFIIRSIRPIILIRFGEIRLCRLANNIKHLKNTEKHSMYIYNTTFLIPAGKCTRTRELTRRKRSARTNDTQWQREREKRVL